VEIALLIGAGLLSLAQMAAKAYVAYMAIEILTDERDRRRAMRRRR